MSESDEPRLRWSLPWTTLRAVGVATVALATAAAVVACTDSAGPGLDGDYAFDEVEDPDEYCMEKNWSALSDVLTEASEHEFEPEPASVAGHGDDGIGCSNTFLADEWTDASAFFNFRISDTASNRDMWVDLMQHTYESYEHGTLHHVPEAELQEATNCEESAAVAYHDEEAMPKLPSWKVELMCADDNLEFETEVSGLPLDSEADVDTVVLDGVAELIDSVREDLQA